MPGAPHPYAIGSDLWPGLSKLIEECGEVLQVAGKLIATGGDINHWDGTNLGERLVEEVADLQAAIEFVIVACQLDHDAIWRRRLQKRRQFENWHNEQQAVSTRTFGAPS